MRTTSFRLMLIYGAFFSLWIVALLGMIYWQTAGNMTGQVDRILMLEAQSLESMSSDALDGAIRDRIALDQRHIYLYGLFDTAGARLSGNLLHQPDALPADGRIRRISDPAETAGSGGNSIVRGMAIRLHDGDILVLGRDVAQLDEFRQVILQALFWGGGLTFVMAILGGLAMSAGPLKRINAIQRVSQSIMLGDLTRRLPIAGRRDELDMLATIVNTMLDQIERLMSEVKSVCDNIAHDLRTPLTRLQSALQRARGRVTGDEEYGRLIDLGLANTGEILSRFTALLRISEIEDRHRRAGFAHMDLGVVVKAVVELYEPVAEDKDISLALTIDPSAFIRGDSELLFEAVSNIVDNAIKFTPPAGRISVAVRSAPAGPSIEVTDTGPGIPPEEREMVLQRFYRTERSRHLPGSGLGLSIVAAIVRLHNFAFEIEDAAGGCRVKILCWPHAFRR